MTVARVAFKDRIGWATAALVSVGSLAACASAAGSMSGGTQGCAAGEVYCATCNGGGFCSSQGCPAYACPVVGPAAAEAGADAGSVDDAASVDDANGTDSGLCPADKPSYCLDCSGGGFCVSGPCPASTCPVRDAGALPSDGGADAGCRSNADCPNSTCSSPFTPLPYPAPAAPIVIGTAACDADRDCYVPYWFAPFCKSNACSAGCNSDLDCAPDGGNLLCVTVFFPNRGSTNSCTPGCFAGGCPEGSACASSHRCVPSTCSGASNCPAQFDCVQGTCTPRGCQKDADCPSGGYCFGGQCSTYLGTCAPTFQ
jgi:hypothetical protein